LPLLFALTLFVSAALLFVVQPMVAKMVLPLLGGSPAVWSTCMVFFQGALLAGYAYAHLTAQRLSIKRQILLHAVLLVLPALFLPFGVTSVASQPPSSGASPALWLLGLLVMTVGVPFFVVASTAPLLQRWFAETRHTGARDPYYLYGASNLGSMLALASYPFLLEPNLPIMRQTFYWSIGYAVLALLTLACGVSVWLSPAAEPEHLEDVPHERPSGRQWLRWIALAFVPSSWMLGVTSYLSIDIAPVPLLWVVPLALYLLTFVMAFARRQLFPHRWVMFVLPWVVVALALVMGLGRVDMIYIGLHLLAFFVGALACHGELANSRPAPRHLTFFYLALAIGGVLGGIFNALIAPNVFNRLSEYPIAVLLGCMLLRAPARATRAKPKKSASDDLSESSEPADASLDVGPPKPPPAWSGWKDLIIPVLIFGLTALLLKEPWSSWSSSLAKGFEVIGTILASGLVVLLAFTYRRKPVRFALGVGAAWIATGVFPSAGDKILVRRRSFFGISRVSEFVPGPTHYLFLGTTIHGIQVLSPALEREPMAYFFRTGPMGQIFETVAEHPTAPGVAIIGLGAGTLAAYAKPGEHWDFYEIDPIVINIANNPRYFTYLRDCRADSKSIILGDARLRLRETPAHGYGLIIFDAFSSDAVPTHLLTREAIQLYREKLADGGLMAFDVTNRYLDLEPVIAALADDAGLVCRIRADVDISDEEREQGKYASIWAVMAARESDLGAIATDPRWEPARLRPGDRCWTDDFSDLASHLQPLF
jgi:hypothetical protein